MNKSELIKSISVNSGISQKKARIIVNAFLETISDTIADGDFVKLSSFGKWYVKTKSSRRAFNINTQRIDTIPAKRVVAFSSSKFLLLQRVLPEQKTTTVEIKSHTPFEPLSTMVDATCIHYATGKTSKANPSKVVSVSRNGNKIDLDKPNLGRRVNLTQTIESGELKYCGKTTYNETQVSDTEKYSYPSVLIPFVDTPILEYRTKRYATGGIMEPVLLNALNEITETEPNIQILQNISLPIKNRNYGYKPDIAIIWREKNIFIDIEIDEPYDVISRKPIHYKGGGDNLRNAYFLDNGWSVIRIAEKQIVDDCSRVVEYIKVCLAILSEDGRFNARNEVERIERWSYTEAEKWADSGFRESYLKIEKVSTSEGTIDVGDEISKYADGSDAVFVKPAADIISDRYTDIREDILHECENGKYIIFTIKYKCYDYMTLSNNIQFIQMDGFYGLSFYDIVEGKDIFLKFQELGSYRAVNDLYKYEASYDDWGRLLHNIIFDSNPLEITYSTASRGGSILKRTILYPTFWYSKIFSDDHRKTIPANILLEVASSFKYRTLAEDQRISYFTGFCTSRNEIRTFNINRIIDGRIFNCRKDLYKISVSDIWNLLEEGFPDMVVRMYEKLSDKDKLNLFNLGNYANALVMQDNHDEAVKIYESVNPTSLMPKGNTTWKEACIGDFEFFISKGLKKEEFENIKQIMKEKGW